MKDNNPERPHFGPFPPNFTPHWPHFAPGPFLHCAYAYK